MTADTIEDTALHLLEQRRAQLAHKLLVSLVPQSETEIAEAWRSEAQRRAADLYIGLGAPISAGVVRTTGQS